MLDAKLVVVGGDDVANEYPLTLPATIGRGLDNTLPLSHPLVSRTHCRLFEKDGRLHVEDLGSLNGTYVGNQQAIHPTVLEPGKLLTIGTVTFRAIYGDWEDRCAAADGAAALEDVIESDFATSQEGVSASGQTLVGPQTQPVTTQPVNGLSTKESVGPGEDTKPIPDRLRRKAR